MILKIIAKFPWLSSKISFTISLAVLTLCLTVAFPTLATLPPIAQQSPTVEPISTPAQLLDRGRQLYGAGRFAEAITLWEQVQKIYATEGAALNQAMTLNYLATAYQELGQLETAKSAIASSFQLLQSQNKLDLKSTAILAQAWNTQGSLLLATGQTQSALAAWETAEATYETANNPTGKLGSQLNQAQALQTLGLYRRTKNLLERINQQLQTQPDSLLKAESLQSLGRTLQLLGDLRQSKEVLEASWEIAKQQNSPALVSKTLVAIGNVARDLQQNQIALDYYQEAATKAPDSLTQMQARLNQLSLYAETQQQKEAIALASEILPTLANLPPSRPNIYSRINFAQSALKIGAASQRDIAQILVAAVQQAKELQDSKAESYAIAQLGELYAQAKQWQDAETLTKRSIATAQSIDIPTLVARSSWQLGRIYQQQGDFKGAIAAYTEAYHTLQSLRNDLIAVNSDVQFSFTKSVEPVYRELVSLLLREGAPEGQVHIGDAAQQVNIKLARQVVESLQLAEIENFFKEACLDVKPKQIDEIDPKSAVIYPIILPDRLEVILSLPGQPLRHYRTFLPDTEIERRVKLLYSSLYLGYSSSDRLRYFQEAYKWLIEPAEPDLAANNIKTLAFVLDGSLRNLPMSALYDGKQYLVEKYSVALSLGLQLLPEALQHNKIKVLAAGLTQARQGFPALPGVAIELKGIAAEVKSDVFIDRNFVQSALEKNVKDQDYSIIHLATHGQFSSNPDLTFLLSWDDRINVRDLSELLKTRNNSNPLELLVLSACQTAAGDPKAALGLAGLAVRSGASSTIASLWSVSDESTTKLMVEFYHQLSNSKLNKAEALRAAQLSLLQDSLYNHPYFWASFILVGNWL